MTVTVSQPVNIVNAALALIGQRPISSMTEEIPIAQQASNLWPVIRDSVLRGTNWPCARASATLGRLTDTVSVGYDYTYALPADCLMVWHVVCSDDTGYVDRGTLVVRGSTENQAEFEIEGPYLLSNEDSVSIVYTKRLENVAQYDALLVETLVLKMALALSYDITGSSSIRDRIEKDYEKIERKARSRAIREGYADIPASAGISARY